MEKILYVSSSEGKYVEITRSLKVYAHNLLLEHYQIELEEIQSLDERNVLRHKAAQAWKLLQRPLLIDDAGCYLHAYPKFPGTIAKPVLDTLGYKGLFRLTEEDNQVEHYVGLVYVDHDGCFHYFRGATQGHLVPEKGVPAPYTFNFYKHFQPEGLQQTAAEIWADPNFWSYFARVKVAQQFADWFQSTYQNKK
jgi:XTP/dITP diphosphohydrolase